jgi:hypothetical protein
MICSRSTADLGLDEMGERRNRFLPPEVAELDEDRRRQPFLHDLDLRPAHDRQEGNGDAHLARQVGALEP